MKQERYDPIRGAIDPAPLITAAIEREAERLSLIRSLSRDVTGLSLRRHNNVVRLLERLASDTFSDGVATNARVATLCQAFQVNRSTVFRWIADAEACGLLAHEPRFAPDGRQLSSERVVQWDRLRELVRNRAPESVAKSSEVSATGRVATATGRVATATPIILSSPETIQSNWSGHADRKFSKVKPAAVVDASHVAPMAGKLFARLNAQGDGHTLWMAAAGVHAGLLTAADVGRALEATTNRQTPPRDPVAFFRHCLAEKAACGPAALTERLRGIRIAWGTLEPWKRPPDASHVPAGRDSRTIARPRAAPRSIDNTQAATEAARERILRELATVASSDER